MTDVRFYICAVPSKDVVELVHDGGGLWAQRGRGAWHRMSSKADNTSNTSNADLCSGVANFVAVGYVLAELELLLLLLSPAPPQQYCHSQRDQRQR